MKRLFTCSLFLLLFLSKGNMVMSSPIAKTWIHATVLIENEWGKKGTGFLVGRKIEGSKGKIFLCTNKHVLNKEKSLREKAIKIKCHINIADKKGNVSGRICEIPLTYSNGKKRWREHPEQDVDVLVFDVTILIVELPEMKKGWVDYSLFADKAILLKEDITIGEEVMIIGYPLGFKQGTTNYPIVRQGIIASQIGKEYSEEYIDKRSKKQTKVYRGFLIDGGLIHGSSGSPVVLKPVPGRFVGDNIVMGSPKPYLLGIVAETRYAPIETKKEIIPSFAGLGLAFDVSTIRETIELFFK